MRVWIITPQAPYIEKTIRSVLSQDHPQIEYIIVDDGSRDGTLDIIKKYQDQLTCWVSEKVQRQTNAINKGFARAKGDFPRKLIVPIWNWLRRRMFNL